MSDTESGRANAQPQALDTLLEPGDVADPEEMVRSVIPGDLWARYEFYSYRNAALVLKKSQPASFDELMEMLRGFSIDTTMIREPGGNKSRIVKCVSSFMHGNDWSETTISGDLNVVLSWREKIRSGVAERTVPKQRIYLRKGFLDGHKIDYVKGKVAFDMEWNSKDQTYDRDLYAFRVFHEAGAIDVGVILTRGFGLDIPFFRSLGKALTKEGTEGTTETYRKFGASTTWMGKLLYRLEAGRNGGCPVLAVGITQRCVTDWRGPNAD